MVHLWCGWHSFDVIWHPFDVGGILVIWGSFKVYDGGTLRCDVAPLWCEEKYMTMAPLWCEAVSTKNGDNFRELSPRLWRLLHTSKIKIFYTISNRPLIQQKISIATIQRRSGKIEALWKLLRLSDLSLLLFLRDDMMIRKKWKSHPKSMWMKCIWTIIHHRMHAWHKNCRVQHYFCVTRAPLLYFVRSWVTLSFKVCHSVRKALVTPVQISTLCNI